MNQLKLDHNEEKSYFDLDQKAIVGGLHKHQISNTSKPSLHCSSEFSNEFNPIEYFRKTMGVKNLSETKQSLALEEKKKEQCMEGIFTTNKVFKKNLQGNKQISKTYFDENRLSKLKVAVNKDCKKKVKHLVKDNKNTKRSDKK